MLLHRVHTVYYDIVAATNPLLQATLGIPVEHKCTSIGYTIDDPYSEHRLKSQ